MNVYFAHCKVFLVELFIGLLVVDMEWGFNPGFSHGFRYQEKRREPAKKYPGLRITTEKVVQQWKNLTGLSIQIVRVLQPLKKHPG